MSFNCCFIDYSMDDNIDLNISKQYPYKEITIKTECANIYIFAATSSIVFDNRYILIVDGETDSLKESLEKIKTIGIGDFLRGEDNVFALTLYDRDSKKLYISRDHFGLKQNYYYKKSNLFLTTNSLKILKNCSKFKKEIDFNSLGQYLQHSYILEPYTIFLDCFKVKSSNYIEYNICSRELSEYNYWNIVDCYNRPKLQLNEDRIIKESEELLKESIKLRVTKSKKVGAFLSGGLDSSTIVSLLSQIDNIELHTYTVGFMKDEVNEAPYAKKIADYLGVNHHEHYFNARDLKDLIENFAKVYDEPIADKAALPTMLIAKIAKDDIDIIFGGEGGDEIFASSGFLQKYRVLNSIPFPIRYMASLVLRLISNSTKDYKWAKMLRQKDIENVIKYKDIIQNFTQVSKLIKREIKVREIDVSDMQMASNIHYLDKIFPLLIKSYVSNNLLQKIYFSTTYYNIKPKTPYLDRRFVEYLAQVDINLKRKSGVNKYILKEILKKYIPTKLIDRPKRGFAVPVGELLKNELRELLDYFINHERIIKEGIFDVNEVMKIKERFLTSDSYYDEQNIWNILIFQLWYEEWFSVK